MVLQGVPTDQILQTRVDLLNRLGKSAQAQSIKGQMPPPAAPRPIQIKFVLLARQELRFGHNTMFQCVDSNDPKHPGFPMGYPGGSCASICCPGVIRKEGNFLFNGTTYRNAPPVDAPAPHTGDGGMVVINNFSGKVPSLSVPPGGMVVMTDAKGPSPQGKDASVQAGIFPLPPTPQPPPGTPNLPEGAIPNWQAGDYIATNIDARIVNMSQQQEGRTRIFLIDDRSSPSTMQGPSIMNNRSAGNLQVFYNGSKRIHLGQFKGILYAPNATVEIGFNGRVTGAIVANKIIGEGNNTYEFDMALKDKVL
jgi:hypothetical protein